VVLWPLLKAQPGFCFHTINAYEVPPSNGDESRVDVICDMIEYDNLDVLHKFYYENMRASSPSASAWMAEKQAGCNQHYARYKLPSILKPQSLPNKSRRMNLHKFAYGGL